MEEKISLERVEVASLPKTWLHEPGVHWPIARQFQGRWYITDYGFLNALGPNGFWIQKPTTVETASFSSLGELEDFLTRFIKEFPTKQDYTTFLESLASVR